MRFQARMLSLLGATLILTGCSVWDIERVSDAIEKLAESDQTEQERCEKLVDDEKYQEAIECFTAQIAKEPKSATPLEWRAYCYKELMNWEKAIEDAEAAAKLDPKSETAYEYIGNCYEKLNDFAKAEEAYKQAIEADPEDPDGHYYYGKMLESLGRRDEAIAELTKSLELEPNDVYTHTVRGLAYSHKGDYKKAIEDFDAALREDSEYAYAYFCRAAAYDRLHLTERALKDYTDGLEYDSNSAEAYLQRGSIYLCSNKWSEAMKELDEAYRLNDDSDSDYIRAALLQAVVKQSHGDKGAADSLVTRAMKRSTNSYWPFSIAAYAQKKLEAKDLLSIAVSQYEQTEAHSYIGLLARAQGDEKTAKKEFEWVKKNGVPEEPEYRVVTHALAHPDFLKPKAR
jgi:tetratricopeptide (TPR) repeat protein